MGPAMSDYNMRLILSSVIQLSGGYCAQLMLVFTGKEKWKKLSTANYDEIVTSNIVSRSYFSTKVKEFSISGFKVQDGGPGRISYILN